MYEPDDFVPTPREEEILARCVNYGQFRDEITALTNRIETLEKEKLLHVCPKCGEAGNWRSNSMKLGDQVSSMRHACGHVVSYDEWKNLERRGEMEEISRLNKEVTPGE